jgi:acyl-coenzyme A synthetase/AMP-(fatty) acid ligase
MRDSVRSAERVTSLTRGSAAGPLRSTMAAVMTLAPPAILFEGRLWSTDEMTAMVADRWRELAGELGRPPRLVALAMANHPEAVALLLSLSCFGMPVALLPADLRGWQCSPPVPAGTPLFLPPPLHHLAAEGERLGLRPRLLRAADPAAAGRERPPILTGPGLVFFTSGSTGSPRPVYRRRDQLVAGGGVAALAFGIGGAGGFIGALPLDRTFGMHHTFLAALLLESRLALLPRFQHHAVLELFASGEYEYWAGTPVMADVLGRCRLSAGAPSPHPAPPFCVISGRLSPPVSEAFRNRFGVPLRQLYGATETGPMTMDAAPPDAVRSETAGRPLPGVRVAIGDDPRQPLPSRTLGRVWISSAGIAPGYGFPPDLDSVAGQDGWWAAPDVGEIDYDGRLLLAGRLDDCVRTAAGQLVSTAAVASLIETHPHIAEAVVVPVGPAEAPTLAALVESAQPLDLDGVKAHVAARVSPAAMPRIIDQVRALPRLPSGKPDRLACIAQLDPDR